AVSVYSELSQAQDLLGYDNRINGFEIRGANISSAELIKNELKFKLDQNIYEVKTWFDLHKQLYSVMLIERWTAYIILSLIIAVATFSIFGSLIMTVIEKKRDIGILKSMGATNKSILKIFLIEGTLIGIIGAFLGTVIGLIVCYLQIEYKLYPLDSTIYIIDALPVEIRIVDIVVISVSAIFLSTLAGLYPAFKASKTVPLEAIRWE
ncbi:MAG: FtsX-like permease family protein, partial [Ignavibacteria bacterium]|nr:FtsX-like permease family protein [Ignavibacteria bacterium]